MRLFLSAAQKSHSPTVLYEDTSFDVPKSKLTVGDALAPNFRLCSSQLKSLLRCILFFMLIFSGGSGEPLSKLNALPDLDNCVWCVVAP